MVVRCPWRRRPSRPSLSRVGESLADEWAALEVQQLREKRCGGRGGRRCGFDAVGARTRFVSARHAGSRAPPRISSSFVRIRVREASGGVALWDADDSPPAFASHAPRERVRSQSSCISTRKGTCKNANGFQTPPVPSPGLHTLRSPRSQTRSAGTFVRGTARTAAPGSGLKPTAHTAPSTNGTWHARHLHAHDRSIVWILSDGEDAGRRCSVRFGSDDASALSESPGADPLALCLPPLALLFRPRSRPPPRSSLAVAPLCPPAPPPIPAGARPELRRPAAAGRGRACRRGIGGPARPQSEAPTRREGKGSPSPSWSPIPVARSQRATPA